MPRKKGTKSRRLKPAKSTLTFSLHELIEMSDGLQAQFQLLWKVENLLNWQIMKHEWTQEEKEWFRHNQVYKALLDGVKWDDVFEYVSSKLAKDHPAWGEEGTIEAGYKAHQRKLPPEQRLPRISRRRRG
jgi:hypothetical protein